jgi:hypothetical protein
LSRAMLAQPPVADRNCSLALVLLSRSGVGRALSCCLAVFVVFAVLAYDGFHSLGCSVWASAQYTYGSGDRSSGALFLEAPLL